MNKEAYWRGFIKAATTTGLTSSQILQLVKKATTPPANQGAQIPALGSPAINIGQPQPLAAPPAQPAASLALPLALEEAAKRKLEQTPTPAAVSPLIFNHQPRIV